uniref:Uncharacterized protein n=1 Tax=Bubo bubo TaxID=30461 RepID=A0A8C0EJK5_BUBBB
MPPDAAVEDSQDRCSCPTPCNLTRYGKEISMVRIPNKGSARYLARKYNKNETYIRENFLVLDIFFEALNYEAIEQKKAYDLAGLLGDIGGQMGLFIGASILTILEILDYVYEVRQGSVAGHPSEQHGPPGQPRDTPPAATPAWHHPDPWHHHHCDTPPNICLPFSNLMQPARAAAPPSSLFPARPLHCDTPHSSVGPNSPQSLQHCKPTAFRLLSPSPPSPPSPPYPLLARSGSSLGAATQHSPGGMAGGSCPHSPAHRHSFAPCTYPLPRSHPPGAEHPLCLPQTVHG